MSSYYGLSSSAIEKDFYITEFLKNISNFQYNEGINVYFKGGTSLYKRFKKPVRFSEDIDLTLDITSLSRSQIKKQLNLITKKYDIIPRSEKYKSIEHTYQSSVQTVYEYKQIYEGLESTIKIEAISFTISKPCDQIYISSLLQPENIFKIKCIDIRRVFTDKIFSVQNNMCRENITEVSKHLFDIYFLMLHSNKIRKLILEPLSLRDCLELTIEEENLRMESRIKEYIANPIVINKTNLNFQKALDALKLFSKNVEIQDLIVHADTYNIIVSKIWYIVREINGTKNNNLLFGWD